MKFLRVLVVSFLMGAPMSACKKIDLSTYYSRSYALEVTASRDILTGLAEEDERSVEEAGREFAARHALSDEQGMRAVRITRDFAQLQNRSAQDLEDFARRLYGVNPAEVVNALHEGQMGNREKMNELVEQAAAHFGTTPAVMKEVIRDLHGEALQQSGVEL